MVLAAFVLLVLLLVYWKTIIEATGAFVTGVVWFMQYGMIPTAVMVIIAQVIYHMVLFPPLTQP